MTRYRIEPDRSTVWVDGTSSLHPIRARASGLTGWIDVPGGAGGLTGELEIEVERLRSGNPLVDRETRRRIDAGRHPHITGRVTAATATGDGGYDVTGDLAFRGEVRSVTGTVTATRDGDDLSVVGDQTFDVRDWGLSLPRLGLLRVHPDVTVRIEVAAVAER